MTNGRQSSVVPLRRDCPIDFGQSPVFTHVGLEGLFFHQAVVLKGSDFGLFQFFNLKAQQFFPGGAIPGCRGQCQQFLLGFAISLAEVVSLAQQGGVVGRFIQQAALLCRFQQADMGVLTVYLDQEGSQGLQGGQGDLTGIDISPGAAFNRHDPANQAVIRLGQIVFFQPLPGLHGIGNIKNQADFGPFCAGPDLAAIGFSAQSETQCVQQDGLAGTGFARQDGKSLFQVQFKGFNEG